MRNPPLRPLLYMLLLALAPAAMGANAQAQESPSAAAAPQKASPVSMVHMYSHSDGTTHIERLPLPAKVMPAEGANFAMVMPGTLETSGAKGWHGAPYPQYVLTLSGSAEIEVSGGAERKFIVDATHVLLADDMTGKGHHSTARPVGNEPWVLVYVKVDMSKVRRDAAGRLEPIGGGASR
jgi:hypothetical protein